MDTVHAWIIAFVTAFWPFGDAADTDQRFYGYVEGEYVYIAPQSSGVLQSLNVSRGQTITSNHTLFALDDDKQVIALEKSRMNLTIAQADLADESTGKRLPELAVIEEQLASAKAQLALAEATYRRSSELAALDFVSTSKVDQDYASLEAAQATVKEQIAQLEVARLPARTERLMAAEQSVKSAKRDIVRAEIDLAERQVRAPSEGYIEQTYYQPGEFVAAGSPVVSLLPPGSIRFLFYVGEPQRAGLEPGARVLIGCDGCQQPIRARIVYLSSEAQFTPPVIYSLEDRSKLVFVAHATPDEPTHLLPGQPIDVRLEK